MRHLVDIFPTHLLEAEPAPDRCHYTVEYLDHLLDTRPDLFASALPYADHEELADLVVTRLWSRTRACDLQALADIADHEACDFWIALAVLLRVFPDPQSDTALQTLAADLVTRINADTYRMQYSSTPVVSPRGLDLYGRLSAERDDLHLRPEIVESAYGHAAWLDRRNKTPARFAMFNGAPIWAANQTDMD